MGKRIYSKFLRDFSVKVNALINIGYKDVKEREEEGFDRRHMGGDRRDVWLEQTQFARILITLLLTLG